MAKCRKPIDGVMKDVASIFKNALIDGEYRVQKFDAALTHVHDWANTIPGLKYLTVSKEAREIHEFTRGFNDDIAKSTADANKIALWLRDSLSDDDSITLTRVLGGDLAKADLPEHLRATYEMLRKKLDANTQQLVKLGALAEEHAMENYLKRYYAQFLKDRSGFGIKLGKYFARKNMSHEERVKLGLIEDADFVVANTLLEQRKQLLKAKLLQQLANEIAEEEPKDGYVKVSDESAGGGIKRYGALAGKYVPEEVDRVLQDMQVLKEVGRMANLVQSWMGIVDHIKVNVTVKNPGTHIYNVLSNLQLAFLKGDLSAVADVMRMMVLDRKKFGKLVSLARDLGLNSELDDFEGLVRDFTPKSLQKESGISHLLWLLPKNLYMAEDTVTGRAVRKIYAAEDEIFKLANFYKQIKGKTVSKAKAKMMLRDAMSDYVDYQTPLPTAVRMIDKIGVMPFTHYVWKSTPRVARTIVKHPYKYVLLQVALLETGASMFGDDDYLKKPEWAADKLNLFNAKQWMHLGEGDLWLNLGRSLPGVRWGRLEFDGGFIGGIATVMQGKDPLWGSKFVSPYDNNAQLWFKIGQKLAENYAPSLTYGRYMQKAVRKATGFHASKNAYGEEASWKELLLRPLGIREFNSKKELQKHLHAVIKQWKGGRLNDAEMKREINTVFAYAKKHKMKIDRRKLNRYIRHARKTKPDVTSTWWL